MSLRFSFMKGCASCMVTHVHLFAQWSLLESSVRTRSKRSLRVAVVIERLDQREPGAITFGPQSCRELDFGCHRCMRWVLAEGHVYEVETSLGKVPRGERLE